MLWLIEIAVTWICNKLFLEFKKALKIPKKEKRTHIFFAFNKLKEHKKVFSLSSHRMRVRRDECSMYLKPKWEPMCLIIKNSTFIFHLTLSRLNEHQISHHPHDIMKTMLHCMMIANLTLSSHSAFAFIH